MSRCKLMPHRSLFECRLQSLPFLTNGLMVGRNGGLLAPGLCAGCSSFGSGRKNEWRSLE